MGFNSANISVTFCPYKITCSLLVKSIPSFALFNLYSISGRDSSISFKKASLPLLLIYSSGSFPLGTVSTLTSKPALLKISNPLMVAFCPAASAS
ncbi:hypothetical protein D3C76_912700 [compost metagenome]